MLKLKLNESTNLAFEMIVEGSATKVDMTWLVLETANGYEIRLPASHEGNEVRCVVPALKGVLPNGKTMAHLEVIIDGRFYRPISEEVVVSHHYNDIRISAKPKTEPITELNQSPKKRKSTASSPEPRIKEEVKEEVKTQHPKYKSQEQSSNVGRLRVNMTQMKKWKVDQDNIKYYDNIVKNKGKISTVDVRPYEEYLNGFGIYYTKTMREEGDSKVSDTQPYTPPTGSEDDIEFGVMLDEKLACLDKESTAKSLAAKEIAKQFVESIVPTSPAAEKAELAKLQKLISSKDK